MGRSGVLVVAAALVGGCTSTPPAPGPPASGVTPVTVPALMGWTPANGSFQLTSASRVVVDPRQAAVHDEARTFADDAAALVGRRLPVGVRAGFGAAGDIVLRLDHNRTDLGAEGYALSVGSTVTVTARTDAGAFYGTRTILQMLRAGRTLPAGSVTDIPRYAERGVGICACIVHISVESLQRLVKDAAFLKLNQLWLELKIKSDRYPDTIGWSYYTKPEMAALQELATRYHVTLIPEVDAPGHMRQWLRPRPDLQLVTLDGIRDPNSLDVSKPGALRYVTGIIDEYLTVFDTPFWHLGADEYGGLADAQDAFVDFVNRVNAHVKGKDKRLRIWNDGVTGIATVPLDTDIVVEYWQAGNVRPSMLIDRGYTVMNAAASLYHGRGGGKIDTAALYAKDWSPQAFEGETLPASPKITGAKITLWPDNGSAETENEIEAQIFLPLRFIAQSTWGPTRPDPDFAAFTTRANTAGRSPGLIVADPIPDGTVTLAVGGRFLAPVEPAAGTALTANATASDWRLERTPDGYYTIRHITTGLCAETRLGTRDLNTPLEAGTPITGETCDAANRLQRWQLTKTGDTVTLTNAITRMVAVLTDKLIQQIPDGHSPAAFTLVR